MSLRWRSCSKRLIGDGKDRRRDIPEGPLRKITEAGLGALLLFSHFGSSVNEG